MVTMLCCSVSIPLALWSITWQNCYGFTCLLVYLCTYIHVQTYMNHFYNLVIILKQESISMIILSEIMRMKLKSNSPWYEKYKLCLGSLFWICDRLVPCITRDLKAENVLLGADGAWKLCDFGSTSTNHKCFDRPEEMGIEEDNIRKHTTPAYRAPEVYPMNLLL